MSTPHFRLGNILGLVGGVLAVLGYFLPAYSVPFFGLSYAPSMWDLALQQPPPPGSAIFAPQLLLALVLLVCALLATTLPKWFNVLLFLVGGLGCLALFLAYAEITRTLHINFGDLGYLGFGFLMMDLGFAAGGIGGAIDFMR